MTHNKKQTIPAAIPVEDLAAHMRITPKVEILEAPPATVNPTMPTGPYFPVPEPAPTRQMIWLGPNMRVPLDSVTLIDDDDEVAAAPPEPNRPKWVVSPEVERRLALYGGARSPFSVLDFEREILLERYEADLAAGVVDDEESPF